MEPKCSENASGVTGVSKCGLKVATGGQGDPEGAKKVPKTRPGAPPGMPFGHLGLQTRTFAKHRYLPCKTYICTPWGAPAGHPCQPQRPPWSTDCKNWHKSDANGARGTPQERPGWPPQRPGCQKVSEKVTENDNNLYHLAPRLSQEVPGSLLGAPSWQSV